MPVFSFPRYPLWFSLSNSITMLNIA
jgi:hypothetical protein